MTPVFECDARKAGTSEESSSIEAVPPAEDELRAEYDFDYGEAKPNRFSAETIPAAPDPDEAG
jgi:hypothetical protein